MAGELQRVPETSTDLEKLKHAITINQIIARFRDSAVSIDHGDLAGLTDDDHTQYYNTARLTVVLADYALTTDLANYYTIVAADAAFAPISHTHVTADITNLSSYTGFDARYYTEGEADAAFAPISHTHDSTDITDFAEAVDDRVNGLLVAGTNITLTYNDGSNTLTIASSGGSGDVSTDAIWDAKGDLAAGTGANAASKLAVGANGDVLTADSSTATGLKWAAPASGGGSMSFVASATVSGSAATTLTVSGLDLDADEAYFISIELDEAAASSSNVSLYYNSDTTASNYDNQVGVFFGSSSAAARANNAILFSLTSGAPMSFTGWLRRNIDGHPRLTGEISRYATTSLDVMIATHAWRTASTNITGITLSASVANSLAIGTTIRVWKLVAA